MADSALLRLSRTSFNSTPEFNQTQALVDSGVTHFLEESAHFSTFASIVAGGGAARLARGGILALGANATGRMALLVQGAASVGSLGAEVVAFESTARSLDHSINPNRWRWEGTGGLRQGFYSSFITFGSLRGAGLAAQGQNIIFQHAAQASAMVGGHNLAGALHLIPTPEGSLAEQFFEAERTNISLCAGMAVLHTTLPGIHAWERSLDVANQGQQSVMGRAREGLLSGPNPQVAVEMAGGGSEVYREGPRSEISAANHANMMMEAAGETAGNGNGGREGPRIPSIPPPISISERGSGGGGPPSFPPPSIPPAPSTPPPPSGRRRSSGGGMNRFMAPFIWLGKHFNLNANFNPDAPLPPSRTDSPVPRIRSVQEGIARAQARGLDRQTMAALRRNLDQLHGNPEVQIQYLELMDKVFNAQTRLQEGLDPILQRFPQPDRRSANEAARLYSESLERLSPNAGRYFAEATLLFWRTQNLRTVEDFRNISEGQLRDMGIEPGAIASMRRHGHAIPRNQLETLLNHPLLRELPETAALRQAMRTFFGDTVREGLLDRLEDPAVRETPEAETARNIIRQFDAQDPWGSLQRILGDPPTGRPETNEQRIVRLTVEVQQLRRKALPPPEESVGPLLEQINALERVESMQNEEGRSEINRLREAVRQLREATELKKLDEEEARENTNFQEAAGLLRQILERSLQNSENGAQVFDVLQGFEWNNLIFGRQRIIATRVERIRGPVAEMRQKIANTSDAVERKNLEGEIKRLSESLKRPYLITVGRFNDEVGTFLSDPVRGRIFLVENARQTALIRGLQDGDRPALAGRVREVRDRLPIEARRAADEFLNASEEMELVSSRGHLSRLFNGALRVFDLDRHPPLEVRGRYERALLALIREAPRNIWNFGPSRLNLLRKAAAAETRSLRAYYDLARSEREAIAPLEPEIEALWTRFDKDLNDIYSSDLALQFNQALSEMMNPETTAASRDAATAAIAKFDNPDPDIRGRNSRDINRTQEAGLQKTSAFRRDVRRSLRSESGSDFEAVSALMAPVAEKLDRPNWKDGIGETLLSLGTLLWHTPMTIGRLVSSTQRGETPAVLDRRFQEWSVFQSRGGNWLIGKIQRFFGFQDNFIVDPSVRHLVERGPISNAGKHDAWLDFGRGHTPLARSVQLNGSHSHRDAVRILAKQGLPELVGPVLGPGIRMLTEEVGDSAPEFDGTVTNAARAMAYGDIPSGRLGPRSASAYDELTMSVASILSPYAYDPYPPTSSMLGIGQGGRSFNIADRATALTSRAQDMLLTVTLNAYTVYPKPDRPFPMRRGPLTTVTEWWPYFSLTTAEAGPRAENARANLLRTLWYMAATTPEYERPVPAIEKIFKPYERPGNPAVEAELERRFGGNRGLYPSIEGVETSRRYVADLETRLRGAEAANSPHRTELEGQLRTARAALVNYEIQFYETPTGRERLRQDNSALEPAIQNAEIHVTLADRLGANRWELRELRRGAENRRDIWYNVNDSLSRDRPLSETELREWVSLRNTMQAAATHPDAQRILDQLGGLIAQVSQSDLPERRRILSLLKSRRAQVALGNARLSLGERLGPTEEMVIGNMEGSLLFHDPARPHDPLVSLIASGRLREAPREEVEKILNEETIRETTRRLVRRLPGAGRGTIDAVKESAEEAAQVIVNGVHQVVAGPRSRWATARMAFNFAVHASRIGFVDAVLDSLTGGRFHLWNRSAPNRSMTIVKSSGARLVVTPEDIRTVEEIRIRSRREGRPIVIAATHASWTDITSLLVLLPEARFIYKSVLHYIPVLTAALLAGHHSAIDRPKSRERYKTEEAYQRAVERSRRQTAAAGQRMKDYEVATINFTPGTRSKSGTIGSPKKGAAHLALDTDALVLTATLNGTDQGMPVSWGSLILRGAGTGRRIYTRLTLLDPREIVSSETDRKVQADILTDRIQSTSVDAFTQTVGDLRRLANQGDAMAQGQLAELIGNCQEGMNFVRQGREAEARAWAERMKTDYNFLVHFTRWWDGQSDRPIP